MTHIFYILSTVAGCIFRVFSNLCIYARNVYLCGAYTVRDVYKIKAVFLEFSKGKRMFHPVLVTLPIYPDDANFA